MSLSKYTDTPIIYIRDAVNIAEYSGKGAERLNRIINTSLYLGE